MTILEIVIAISILGTMFIWITRTVMGGYQQASKTEEHTLGAVAAATVMDRIRDCITADPGFFSDQRLTELEIVPSETDASQFELRALFVEQDSSALTLPDSWANLHRSELFTAFAEATATGSTDPATGPAGLSSLAFRLTIGDEFAPGFSDLGAACLCKRACVEIFRLKDLATGREVPTFRLTRSFLAPNQSLNEDQSKILNAQTSVDDTEQTVQTTKEKIAPAMTDLTAFPKAQEFAATLMLIAAEMNREAFECRNATLPGVATPAIPVCDQPFWGYESQIATLEPKVGLPMNQLSDIIKRATLHRRAATRILEAHKRCLGPSRKVQRMVDDLRYDLRDFVIGPFHTAGRDLDAALDDAATQANRLAQFRTSPPPPELAASAAVAIKGVVLKARAWDALFQEGKNLENLQLANLFNNLLMSLFHPLAELDTLPQRYIDHLRAARDRYYDLLDPTRAADPQLTPHALGTFAHQALETQMALALTGTDTTRTRPLLETLGEDHRLRQEAPQLFREYWGVQVDIAQGLSPSSALAGSERDQLFRARNASYTRDVIPTLIGLAEHPASFAMKFSGGDPPLPILRAVKDGFDSNRIQPTDWSLGGFIGRTIDLYFDAEQKLRMFDRAMQNADGTPTPIRADVLGIIAHDPDCHGISNPTIEEMLATSTRRNPCSTLHAVLKPLLEAE